MAGIDEMKESGIREIFEKARSMKDVVDLSIGQPDISVPKKIKERIKRAIDEDFTGYTQSAGDLELRNFLMEKYKDHSCAKKIIITPGVTAGIFQALAAIPGKSVLIPDPYFVVYPEITRFLGLRPIFYRIKNDLSVDIESIERSITKDTKAMIINSPSNPTGHIIGDDEMRSIVEIAKKHSLYIISDEIYSNFDYSGKFVSPGKGYEKTILLDGFSKRYSMTGLRIGYALGPEDMIDRMIKLGQYTSVCAPSISQKGVIGDVKTMNLEIFKKRRDYVYEQLKDLVPLIEPEGAFYAMIPSKETGTAFSEKCLKKGLLVVPGKVFSRRDDFVRISFAVKEEDLIKGISILKEILS